MRIAGLTEFHQKNEIRNGMHQRHGTVIQRHIQILPRTRLFPLDEGHQNCD